MTNSTSVRISLLLCEMSASSKKELSTPPPAIPSSNRSRESGHRPISILRLLCFFVAEIDFIDNLTFEVYMLPELYQSQLHFVLGHAPFDLNRPGQGGYS
jgi:hypothetical protein